MACKLFLVENYLKFSTVFLTAYGHVACRRQFLELMFQLVGKDICFVEVVAVDFNRNIVVAHTATAAAACRNRIVDDFGVTLQFFTDNFGHFEDCALTLVLLRCSDGHVYLVVGCSREQCRNT